MTMGEHDRAVEACNRALALAEQVEDSALLVYGTIRLPASAPGR
jgi:hypothetical protein